MKVNLLNVKNLPPSTITHCSSFKVNLQKTKEPEKLAIFYLVPSSTSLLEGYVQRACIFTDLEATTAGYVYSVIATPFKFAAIKKKNCHDYQLCFFIVSSVL